MLFILLILFICIRPSHQVQRRHIDICNNKPCNKSYPHCIFNTCQSCREIFHSTPSTYCIDHLNVIKPEIINLHPILIEQLINNNNKWKPTHKFIDNKDNIIIIRKPEEHYGQLYKIRAIDNDDNIIYNIILKFYGSPPHINLSLIHI